MSFRATLSCRQSEERKTRNLFKYEIPPLRSEWQWLLFCHFELVEKSQTFSSWDSSASVGMTVYIFCHFDPNIYRDEKSQISSFINLNSGFLSLISESFLSRRHFFNCFSLLIASSTSKNVHNKLNTCICTYEKTILNVLLDYYENRVFLLGYLSYQYIKPF